MVRGKNSKKGGRSQRPAPAPKPAPRSAPEVQQRLDMRVETYEESFSGPIPHPSMLREYELLLPGAADRILTMAENQSAHRQTLEMDVVLGNGRRASRGQFMGFAVALVFGWFSFDLISSGHTVEGTILGTVDLASLVGIFVYGNKRQSDERERKRQLFARRNSNPAP